MSKIFVGQSALRIQLTTGQNIASAMVTEIHYKKPDNTEGSWDAAIGSETAGTIYYDILDDSILDQAGQWKLWAYIKFSDGRNALGTPVTQMVYNPGK